MDKTEIVATVVTLGVVGSMFAFVTSGPRVNPVDLISSFWPTARDVPPSVPKVSDVRRR